MRSTIPKPRRGFGQPAFAHWAAKNGVWGSALNSDPTTWLPGDNTWAVVLLICTSTRGIGVSNAVAQMKKLRYKEPRSLPEVAKDLNLTVWLLNIAPPISLIHIDTASGWKAVQGAKGVQSERRRRQDCRKEKVGWCTGPHLELWGLMCRLSKKLQVFLLPSTRSGVLFKVNVMGKMPSLPPPLGLCPRGSSVQWCLLS